MNEMNDLETQLRSWALRPPSAKLKQQLFARAAVVSAPTGEPGVLSTPASPFRLSWLAPATMALLLMCVLFNQRNIPSAFSGSMKSGSMVAVALSNQNAAAWLPGSFAHEQNSIPAEPLKWTNSGPSAQ
jgi:hypothetical protein